MSQNVTTGTDVSLTVKSGAITSGDRVTVNLYDNDDLRFMMPADSVSITSPKKADGTHANLAVLVNGASDRSVLVLAGGGRATIFGPIYSVEVTPDQTVAGSGVDDVSLIFSGRDRVGRA